MFLSQILLFRFSCMIEEFWAIQQHIQIPSKLPLKNDYMMFKQGVRPEWEDEGNIGGGMWKMVIPNKLRAEQLDKMWLETLRIVFKKVVKYFEI